MDHFVSAVHGSGRANRTSRLESHSFAGSIRIEGDANLARMGTTRLSCGGRSQIGVDVVRPHEAHLQRTSRGSGCVSSHGSPEAGRNASPVRRLALLQSDGLVAVAFGGSLPRVQATGVLNPGPVRLRRRVSEQVLRLYNGAFTSRRLHDLANAGLLARDLLGRHLSGASVCRTHDDAVLLGLALNGPCRSTSFGHRARPRLGSHLLRHLLLRGQRAIHDLTVYANVHIIGLVHHGLTLLLRTLALKGVSNLFHRGHAWSDFT